MGEVDIDKLKSYIGSPTGYPLICNTIGCNKKKNKNDKIKQFEEWREFMDFEFVGVKLKILDVFDQPIVIDGRVERSKFSKHLRAIIQNGEEYQDKKYDLYTDVFHLFNPMPELKNPSKELRVYKEEFDIKISKVFSSTIKSMQKQNLIYYSECYMIMEVKKGVVRQAKGYEVDIINALRKKWFGILKDNRKTISKAIEEFNNTYNYYSTWREHYIKVKKRVKCDTQEEVRGLRLALNEYITERLKKLGIEETEELKNYKKAHIEV